MQPKKRLFTARLHYARIATAVPAHFASLRRQNHNKLAVWLRRPPPHRKVKPPRGNCGNDFSPRRTPRMHSNAGRSAAAALLCGRIPVLLGGFPPALSCGEGKPLGFAAPPEGDGPQKDKGNGVFAGPRGILSIIVGAATTFTFRAPSRLVLARPRLPQFRAPATFRCGERGMLI